MSKKTNKVTDDKIIYGGVNKLVLTKWKNTGGVWALDNTDSYVLLDCPEGTTSMTKADGDTTEIKDEQGNVIYTLTTPGTRSLAAETADLQGSILTGLFGFTAGTGDDAGLYVEPVGNPEIYVQADIYFADGAALARAYKVKLNPSVTLESLNAGVGRGVIAGTLLNVGVEGNQKAFALGTPTTADTFEQEGGV